MWGLSCAIFVKVRATGYSFSRAGRTCGRWFIVTALLRNSPGLARQLHRYQPCCTLLRASVNCYSACEVKCGVRITNLFLLYCRFYALLVQLPPLLFLTSIALRYTTSATCTILNSTLQYILKASLVIKTVARDTIFNSLSLPLPSAFVIMLLCK